MLTIQLNDHVSLGLEFDYGLEKIEYWSHGERKSSEREKTLLSFFVNGRLIDEIIVKRFHKDPHSFIMARCYAMDKLMEKLNPPKHITKLIWEKFIETFGVCKRL